MMVHNQVNNGVVELINEHRDRIFDNLRMEAPLFLQKCVLLLARGYWEPYPTQRVGIHESVIVTVPSPPKANQMVRRTACPTLIEIHSLTTMFK